MLVYCYECLAPYRFDTVIPIGGKKLQCSECGYGYTLYPSKVMIGNFHDYLIYCTDLSGRALSIILNNISTVDEYLQLTRRDFLDIRNCGLKTTDELVNFKKTLRKNLGYTSSENELKNKSEMNYIPISLQNDSEFFEMITQKLSIRNFELLVRKYQIDSLEKFMALKWGNLVRIKNCGYKTIREIQQIQNMVIDIIKIIESRNDLKFTDFKSLTKLEPKIRDLLDIGEDVDPEKPFPLLNKWVLSIAKDSERNKNVFMLRMGMLGKPAQTYQQIAIEYDISRERVRGIVEKIKRAGQLPIYRIRLNPLIERAKKIVRSKGNKITCSDLNTHLLCHGTQGKLLKNAGPFIEYLNGFTSWQKAGLNIKNGIVYG